MVKKYHLWATGDDGEGRVMLVGLYENIEDISIPINTFGKGIVITITHEEDKDENYEIKNKE